jgi:hypothetical protein
MLRTGYDPVDLDGASAQHLERSSLRQRREQAVVVVCLCCPPCMRSVRRGSVAFPLLLNGYRTARREARKNATAQ